MGDTPSARRARTALLVGGEAANVAFISGEAFPLVVLGPSLVPGSAMISAAGQPTAVVSVSATAINGLRNAGHRLK